MMRAPTQLPPALLTALVASLLALHWWLGVSTEVGKSVTHDETAHLVSGYSYWRFNDYRLQPENGNLPQRWGALPLLLLGPRLDPYATEEQWALWNNSHVWRIGDVFFFKSGNNTDYMLFCARAAMAFWSAATGLLVFCWARRLWGSVGGLFSLVLFVVSPTALAHGSLVTSDTCAAFWLLAAAGAWWRTSGNLTWQNLALSCGATSLAFVAKFSCVLLIPVFGLLALWRVLSTEPIAVAAGLHTDQVRRVASCKDKFVLLAGIGLIHTLAAWTVIWSFFGWRYSAFAPGLPPAWKFYIPWEMLLADPGPARDAILAALKFKLLPEGYIEGFAHMRYQGVGRGAFLLGEYSNTGWWWFFPYAFLAKSTLGELLATTNLMVAAGLRWLRPQIGSNRTDRLRRDLLKIAPLLVLGTVYWAFSMASTLNIGQRHILPVYPVLFIFAGALVRPGTGPWLRGIAATCLLSTAIESWSIRPHYLAFFNAAVGGPRQGWRQLVDSSLDWGQDLPALADWIRVHRLPGEPVYVSYFGAGNLFYEGLPAHELSPYHNSGRPRYWIELKPGLYSISATMLQDVYSPVRGLWTSGKENAYQKLLHNMREDSEAGRRSRYFDELGEGPNKSLWDLDRLRFARLIQYLRVRPPDAVLNHTQFVFRLDAEEVRVVVDGTLKELAALMERAAAKATR